MMCCHLKPAKFASSCTLLLGLCSLGWAQGGRPPFAPEVLETPWGQRVVPTLETYIDLRTYEELTPGQEWSAGEPIVRQEIVHVMAQMVHNQLWQCW